MCVFVKSSVVHRFIWRNKVTGALSQGSLNKFVLCYTVKLENLKWCYHVKSLQRAKSNAIVSTQCHFVNSWAKFCRLTMLLTVSDPLKLITVISIHTNKWKRRINKKKWEHFWANIWNMRHWADYSRDFSSCWLRPAVSFHLVSVINLETYFI